MEYTYKAYTFIISDHNEYATDAYHVWHMVKFNGTKIRNPQNGTARYDTTLEAYNAAKAWIDRQPLTQVGG